MFPRSRLNESRAFSRIVGLANRATFLLRDTFSVALTPGNINNSLTIDNQLRNVIDTNNQISIISGSISFNTGTAANDGIWWPVQTRLNGTIFRVEVNTVNLSGTINVGFDSNQSGAILDALQFGPSGTINIIPNGGSIVPVGSYVVSTTYTVAVSLRTTGVYWFIKGGTYTYFTHQTPQHS